MLVFTKSEQTCNLPEFLVESFAVLSENDRNPSTRLRDSLRHVGLFHPTSDPVAVSSGPVRADQLGAHLRLVHARQHSPVRCRGEIPSIIK